MTEEELKEIEAGVCCTREPFGSLHCDCHIVVPLLREVRRLREYYRNEVKACMARWRADRQEACGFAFDVGRDREIVAEIVSKPRK